MARPREFDPEQTLDRAMVVFWEKGYFDASMDDLVRGTGVSRYGLYGAFGNKHALFRRALDHYWQTRGVRLLGGLQREDASLSDIRAYFERLVGGEDTARRGCLICKAAHELALHDRQVAEQLRGYYRRIAAVLARALRNARARGELSADVDVESHADLLIAVQQGLAGMARSGMRRERIKGAIDALLSCL